MTGRLPAIVREVMAALAFAGVTLAVATIGGGWIVLARIDPLLAAPGMLLAALTARFVASRSLSVARRAAGQAAIAAVALTGVAIIWGHAAPIVPVGLAALVAAGSVYAADWLVMSAVRLWRVGGIALRSLAVAVPVAALFAWQGVMWAGLPIAYAPIVTGHPPGVVLVTSLPITAMTGARSPAEVLNRAESPIIAVLRRTAAVDQPAGVSAATIGSADVLLLAHPPALDPAALVAVDRYVRRGGRALVLADGLSSWGWAFPVGDPRNPPVTSLLTPLLSHWGLRLDAPAGLATRQERVTDMGQRLLFFSAGRFVSVTPGACISAANAIIFRCRIGRGQVTLVADADFLAAALWQGRPGQTSAVRWRSGNAGWISDEVARLSGRDSPYSVAKPIWFRQDSDGFPFALEQ